MLSVKLRAKATDLPAQKDELVALVKALRKTLKVRPATTRGRASCRCLPLQRAGADVRRAAPPRRRACRRRTRFCAR